MKILFLRLTPHVRFLEDPSHASDYQADLLFHGLTYLPDTEVVSLPTPIWQLYKDQDKDYSKLWGKGFTYSQLLDPPTTTGESHELESFDLAIVCIHHTANQLDDHLRDTLKQLGRVLTKDRVMVVDGWDRRHICMKAIGLCKTYFKRERDETNQEWTQPISFAFPSDKKLVTFASVHKSEAFAPMIPAMHSWGSHPHLKSYKYTDEYEYYMQYQRSHFAYTCAKAGWDSLRHYEIVANHCLPFFTDIEACPPGTLVNWPKKLLSEIKKIPGVYPGTTFNYDPKQSTYIGDTRNILPNGQRGYIRESEFDRNRYRELQDQMYEHFEKHLTTKALANYVLGFLD